MTPLDLPLPSSDLPKLVHQSANRASDLVAEADRERAATWDASLRRLEQEWVDNGWGRVLRVLPIRGPRIDRGNGLTCARTTLFANTCRCATPKFFALDTGATCGSSIFMSSSTFPFLSPPIPGPATWGTPSTWGGIDGS
ncbi:hypothetical protein B0H14DRAFT_3531449 [Mycena olivaceomarginata]|nr:hypothetical protein B0H14DRAFT_3531449 [Mycena olivaceomarginata]